LSNVISAANVITKREGKEAGKKDSNGQPNGTLKGQSLRARKSFTNKALPLFSLFFGKPPKTARGAQTYRTKPEATNAPICTTWQLKSCSPRHSISKHKIRWLRF
jgi:hypothetical protein